MEFKDKIQSKEARKFESKTNRQLSYYALALLPLGILGSTLYTFLDNYIYFLLWAPWALVIIAFFSRTNFYKEMRSL